MIQRQSFVEKFIGDLSYKDSFVSLSGVVISSSDGSFMLDDGTGSIAVLSSSDNIPSFVRVFGKVLQYDDGLKLQADFFQDLSKIDKLLYNKVKKVLNR